MGGRVTPWVTSAVGAIVLALLPTAAPEHAVAAPARTVSPPSALDLSPSAPVVGQTYALSGSTPDRMRRAVVLEVRGQGDWRRAGARTTTASGGFRFSLVATDDERYRVRAPMVVGSRTKARVDRWVSRPVVVEPVAQSAVAEAPPTTVEGDPLRVSATLSPAVAGRRVWLETRAAGGWSRLQSRLQDERGRVAFELPAGAPTATVYRVLAVAAAGRPSVTSSPIQVAVQGRLPRLDITTDDAGEITSHADYAHADLTVDPEGSGLPAYSGRSRFRMRGNSTSWITVKRSYKVKLDKKSEMLGMPDSKDWVLLANFYDRSMLRNNLAFEVSRRLGEPWTPRMVDVELWVNGTYRGVYEFGESIEEDSDRVDIDIADDPSDVAGGGYLLEADSWPDDNASFSTDHGLQIYLQEPELDSTDETAQYVDGVGSYVQEFEDSLYSDHFTDPDAGYRRYVDVDSFVDWYLVNEVMKNNDSSFNNSCWMYRDVGGKLTMGPVWDFDAAAGNRQTNHLADPTGWFLRTNWFPFAPSQFRGEQGHWLNRMFEDPWFEDQVEARWQQVRASLLTLPAYVAEQAANVAAAAERNFDPVSEGGAGMPINRTFLEDGALLHGSWTAEAEHLEDWIGSRVDWMDGELSVSR